MQVDNLFTACSVYFLNLEGGGRIILQNINKLLPDCKQVHIPERVGLQMFNTYEYIMSV
jgi:hypothetical protein